MSAKRAAEAGGGLAALADGVLQAGDHGVAEARGPVSDQLARCFGREAVAVAEGDAALPTRSAAELVSSPRLQ